MQKYLRILDFENNEFGFVMEGIHEIVSTDIPITDGDYDDFFSIDNNVSKYSIVDVNGKGLFDILNPLY